MQSMPSDILFQLTAARRRLGQRLAGCRPISKFQLTAARRRLVIPLVITMLTAFVSTHSRPKAAGSTKDYVIVIVAFQLTAARRRLVVIDYSPLCSFMVSTHSRPKAAGRRLVTSQ